MIKNYKILKFIISIKKRNICLHFTYKDIQKETYSEKNLLLNIFSFFPKQTKFFPPDFRIFGIGEPSLILAKALYSALRHWKEERQSIALYPVEKVHLLILVILSYLPFCRAGTVALHIYS